MDSNAPHGPESSTQRPAAAAAGRDWRTRLWTWFATALQFAVLFGAGAYIGLCTGKALWYSDLVVFIALGLSVLLIYPCALVHELGHWLAARLGGMKVVRMRISHIEVMPLRRGLRMRFRRRMKGEPAGAVVAFADPARRRDRPLLMFMAGGPAANLLAAMLLILADRWLAATAWGWLAMPAAAMNLALAVANLIPKPGATPTDGLWLWRLLRGRAPQFDVPFQRVVSLSLFGCTADKLPADQLSALEAQPFPFSLVGAWYRLKAHQNRGEWEQAVAMRPGVETLLASANPKQHTALRSLIACIRTELAFAEAMHTRDAGVLADDLLPAYAAWEEPHLWPRCVALRAALAGDRESFAHWAAISRACTEDSIDESAAAGEAAVRRSMEALLEGAGISAGRAA